MSSCLVTGGTSGIGREFVTQLAARGDDVIIAARDTDRMASIKAEIEPRYGVSVETIRADLSVRADVDVLAARLEDPERPIDLLVNDAGFGLHAKILDPDSLPLQECAFDVMCKAVLILSAAAGRAMSSRGHGGIINVASSSAWINTGNYSAIKAWVLTFTEGLANELHGSGVKVEALCPGWVHTEFHSRAHVTATNLPEFVWVDRATVVRESLEDLAKGKVISVPTVRWKTAIAVAGLAPRSTMRWLSRNLTSSRDRTDFPSPPAPHDTPSPDGGSGQAGER